MPLDIEKKKNTSDTYVFTNVDEIEKKIKNAIGNQCILYKNVKSGIVKSQI